MARRHARAGGSAGKGKDAVSPRPRPIRTPLEIRLQQHVDQLEEERDFLRAELRRMQERQLPDDDVAIGSVSVRWLPLDPKDVN